MITEKQEIRFPAVAGTFYPAEPKQLAIEIDDYVNSATAAAIGGEMIGLIVPHAGYRYSGLIAGHAFKLLKAHTFDTVVLIGLSHHIPVHGAAVCASGLFRTPLGDIEINEEITSKILEQNDDVSNMTTAHQNEHCLEVQLPFLQRVIQPFQIVPILLQDDSAANVARLSASIATAVAGASVLIIGTTDLCHYPKYDDALRSDHVTIDALRSFDTDQMRNRIKDYLTTHGINNLHCMMCSSGAVYTTIEVTKLLGADSIRILKAANSGDIPEGGRSQVVGYVSAAIIRSN